GSLPPGLHLIAQTPIFECEPLHISVCSLLARCPSWVCAVTRRRFPVGESPTRQTLQPEATGAVMEVTKWLKPLVSVSRIGDSASVQAVTRVNAEQSSVASAVFLIVDMEHPFFGFVQVSSAPLRD